MLPHMQQALRLSRRCLAQRKQCSGGPEASPPPTAAAAATREYFHYLNDHGNLYHLYDVPDFLRGNVPSGPAHIREAKLLRMFHHLLKPNQTGTHPDFPWLSLCRGERNFLKASDRPVVFTEITHNNAEGTAQLLYGGDTLSLPFEPGRLVVCSEGRIYHPSRRGLGGLAPVVPRCAASRSGLHLRRRLRGEALPRMARRAVSDRED